MAPVTSAQTPLSERLARLREITRRTESSWSDDALTIRMESADQYVSVVLRDGFPGAGDDDKARLEAAITASQLYAAHTICAAGSTDRDESRAAAFKEQCREIIEALNGRLDVQHGAAVDVTAGRPADATF